MPDAFTLNYNLTKPEVNASRDTWGTKHNANMDTIDGQLKTLTDTKLSKAGAKTITGATNFADAQPTYNTGVNESPLVTAKDVDTTLRALLPVGAIIMYSGATIPPGWALCNGTQGTPNLVDKFIVGAGSTYAVWQVGGAVSHSHGGATAYHALTIAEMPPHSHGTDATSTDVVVGRVISGGTYYLTSGTTGQNLFGQVAINSEGGGSGHYHGISLDSNIPPYYALYYIMKIWPA